MRSFALLLSVLCLAGAAQAITLSWDGGTPNVGDGTVRLDSATQSFTLSATVTLLGGTDAVAGNASVLTFGKGGATDKDGLVWYSSEYGTGEEISQLGAHIGARWTDTDGPEYDAAGNNVYKIAFQCDWNGSDGWTVTLLVNGEAVPNADGVAGVMDWQSSALPVLSAGAMGLEDTTFGIHVGTSDHWLVSDVAVLPEPTALALLALGVAGVALRRRA